MAAAEYALVFELTKDTPYLALKGELRDICYGDFGENLSRYNGTANCIWTLDSKTNNWDFNSLVVNRVHLSCDTKVQQSVMTWSNGNIFRVTGHLCGEFIGHRWIPRTKAS